MDEKALREELGSYLLDAFVENSNKDFIVVDDVMEIVKKYAK